MSGGVDAVWTCAGCGRMEHVERHDRVGATRAVYCPTGWHSVDQVQVLVGAFEGGLLCTPEHRDIVCGRPGCVAKLHRAIADELDGAMAKVDLEP